MYKRIIRYSGDRDWYDVCVEKMRSFLHVKVQNDTIRNILYSAKQIVMCGTDKFWCCGFKKNIASVTHTDKMTGRNVLGELWNELKRYFENILCMF